MFNIHNQTLKEYLLKAYMQGFNDGCSAESLASMGIDYKSGEMHEIERTDIVNDLCKELQEQLEHMFEWHTRIQFVRLNRYETHEDKQLKKQLVEEFNQTLTQWVEKRINENHNRNE